MQNLKRYEQKPTEVVGRAAKPLPLLPLFYTSLAFALYLFSFCSIPLASAGAGSTAAGFLELVPNARAVGLAESFTALADDASALYWNPAGLSRVKRWSLHTMYHLYIEGVHSQYLSAATHIPSIGGIGLHLTSLDSGDIYKTTEDSSGNLAQANTIFWMSALSASIGWGGEITPELRVGASFTWFQQEIDRTKKMGATANLGLQWSGLPGATIGATVQHLGVAIGNFGLPLTVRLGATTELLPSFLRAAADLVYVQGGLSVKGGAECWLDSAFALRAGYQTGLGTGGLSGLQAGFGVIPDHYLTFDYAIAPMGDFGYSHHASLTANF